MIVDSSIKGKLHDRERNGTPKNKIISGLTILFNII